GGRASWFACDAPYPSTSSKSHTLSLHDALPIYEAPDPRRRGIGVETALEDPDGRAPERTGEHAVELGPFRQRRADRGQRREPPRDRKSTRLNSSHVKISYAVFCLKQKKPTM